MQKYIKYHFLLAIFFQWFIIECAFSQIYAGDNKIYIKGRTGPEIGLDNDPLSCYSWNPKKGLSDSHSPNPIATPDSTTTYKLTIVRPDFSFTIVDEVTVYVVNKFSLGVENGITECMENRELTFTARLEGDLPGLFLDQIEFILHHEGSDGLDLTIKELSFDAVEDITVFSNIGPISNNLHKYSRPFFAEAKYHGNTLTSDTLRIDVYELWIDYVRFDAAKPWKAVVGMAFECNGIGSSDCKNWDWDLDKSGTFNWNPTGGIGKTGKLTIPYSDLSNAKNDYFGDIYGTVIVKCEDGEGNVYSFKSTDMLPAQKVQVFFNRGKNVDGLIPTTFKPPSWFVFWKEFIPMGKILTLEYSVANDGYGSTEEKVTRRTTIYKKASEKNDVTNHYGLHTFYETIAHENHHIVLWEGWWPGGYVADQDSSDTDYYPDLWEQNDSLAIAAGFKVGQDDSYTDGSVGKIYEEAQCRAVERALNSTLYDNKDWSYDPVIVYQGKQW